MLLRNAGCQAQEGTAGALPSSGPGPGPGRPPAAARGQRPSSPRGGAARARARPPQSAAAGPAGTRSAEQHRVTKSSYGTPPPPPCHSPPRSPPRRSRRCRCPRGRPVSTWRRRSPPPLPLSRLPQRRRRPPLSRRATRLPSAAAGTAAAILWRPYRLAGVVSPAGVRERQSGTGEPAPAKCTPRRWEGKGALPCQVHPSERGQYWGGWAGLGRKGSPPASASRMSLPQQSQPSPAGGGDVAPHLRQWFVPLGWRWATVSGPVTRAIQQSH